MAKQRKTSLGVLTSGGDAQGMNAAVRAVVRTALDYGVRTYAIYEGYQGMVDGGDYIKEMSWGSVGGILQQGGTVIGSARCQDFRTQEGRERAALNLILRGIDRLIVIGGDGSLTGANIFRQEWPTLLKALVEKGQIEQTTADQHPQLAIVGLVGSIDNDMFGTDMTIGADTALHRIVDAIDAITSTAASHQRTFVVEVMGRNCGYLALMSAVATGADWVLIPESPPDVDNWEERMCEVLSSGRKAGRRNSLVIIAEGARDRDGNPIHSDYVKQVLEERLNADTRVTILGHVQRGGSPSAYDRNLSTMLGYAAVQHILEASPEDEPQLMGVRENTIIHSPLVDCVQKTHEIANVIAEQNYEKAMDMRGGSFKEAFSTLRTLVRALPHAPDPNQKRLRLAIVHSGSPSPGMNTAVRAAVRLGLDKGHIMMGVHNGFQGLIDADIEEIDWMDVSGWASKGGAELGTNRKIPEASDFYAIAHNIDRQEIDGLLMIGGWSGYEAIYELFKRRGEFLSFKIPMIALPATINNNLPGSQLSIGADTALNSTVEAIDKIKQSAVATRRCFVVEVMGRYCGYLALMSGLATGAERVYIHEEGVSLADLQIDLAQLKAGFRQNKRLGLMIRNENANPSYSTAFMCSLFEQEAGGLFDVRQAILGHLQQGGDPSPFDRIQATRMATRCVDWLIEQSQSSVGEVACIGLEKGHLMFTELERLPKLMDEKYQRPRDQWWLELKQIAKVMAKSAPGD